MRSRSVGVVVSCLRSVGSVESVGSVGSVESVMAPRRGRPKAAAVADGDEPLAALVAAPAPSVRSARSARGARGARYARSARSARSQGRGGRRGGAARAALCGVALWLAAGPAAAGVLDDLVTGYQTASSSWLGALVPMAARTFGILAGLEIAVGALMWVVNRRTVDEMLRGFIRKILVLGLFYVFLSQFPLWVPRIVQGFQAAGQAAGKTQELSPSGVMKVGIDLATRLLAAANDAGFLVSGATVFLAPLATLIVMIAFISIAAQLVMTLVESYLVVTGGVIFLGFAAFRGSAPLADKYIVYAVQVGAKLFLLYLLVSTGLAISGTWTQDLAQVGMFGGNLKPLFDVLAGSIVFALLVWRIPTQVSHFLTQSVHLHLREALAD
jgi:type IV secretion system protein TrbL